MLQTSWFKNLNKEEIYNSTKVSHFLNILFILHSVVCFLKKRTLYHVNKWIHHLNCWFYMKCTYFRWFAKKAILFYSFCMHYPFSPCRNGAAVLERWMNITIRIGNRMHICWRFRVFCSKPNVICFHFQAWSGPLLFFFLHTPILIMPINWPNVSRMCSRYKTSSKLCSFSATDCPIANVD